MMNELLLTLQNNLSFVLSATGIFLGLVLLAYLAEKTICRGTRTIRKTKYLAVCAMCTAISSLLMLIELPVFFAPGFYKFDLSELPVLFCGFYLGPVAGVVCEFLKVVVKLLLKGTTTAFVGDFANFAVGCSMILPATIIYHCKKTKSAAILGLMLGTACMAVFGSLFNAVYLLPKFSVLFGMPLEAIVQMGSDANPAISSVSTLVLFAVVPLNLLKGAIVSFLTLALYKRIQRVLFTG